MKKAFLFLLILLIGSVLFAQQKYALVIGNGAYSNIVRLNNPVNDARDIASVLQGMGFIVDRLENATQEQIESAAIRLKNNLSSSRNSYGFLFYAGHAVQSGGENYLLPVDINIQSESFLRSRAVSVQAILDELNAAGNELNVVVLDACRDNPFSWNRSASRGLTIVNHQPADSIIVFATSAGSVASDGTGRNGLFTSHFLTHLRTPGLEVTELFRRTMGDVSRASNNQQRPAVYNQFSGLAYLGTQPEETPVQPVATVPPVQPVVTASIPEIPAEPIRAPSPEASRNIFAGVTWAPNQESGSSTARYTVNTEYIEGQLREVMTIDVNVARNGAPHISTNSSQIIQRMRAGSGVRFKVLGDGKSWQFFIATRDTEWRNWRTTFTTGYGRVVQVDIPFSRLRQPRVQFNRNQIEWIVFERNHEQGIGAASIKIFDFEIY